MLENQIKEISKIFIEKTKGKEIFIVSHFDTDGITSATIMIQALKKIDKKFSLKIIKSLEQSFIKQLPKDKPILFLDLASNSISNIIDADLKDVFIIDHHEINQEIPESIKIINPQLNGKSKISASGLTYLFCKQIDESNKDFAKLAILGMIGDRLDSEIGKLNHGILDDGEIKRRRGLLIYPATRPLNRTLEYCSNPLIPGVTGETAGVFELLRNINITPKNGNYPSLLELTDEEMEKLVTEITLRLPKQEHQNLIGDIFLIKMFNKLEDARELSAMINACSRLGHPEIAIQLCMEIPSSKKKSEIIHAKYKQHIIAGLKFVNETNEKIQGNGFVIINAKDQIKETIVGTIASIISSSSIYEEGTVVTTMAHYDDKIKISLRNVGRNGRNLHELITRIMETFDGEVGGHSQAAGAIISQEQEKEFINSLKKSLEVEVVRV